MDSCMLFLVYLFISGTTLSLISFKQEKEKEELFCTLCNSRRIIVQLVTTCFLCSAVQSEIIYQDHSISILPPRADCLECIPFWVYILEYITCRSYGNSIKCKRRTGYSTLKSNNYRIWILTWKIPHFTQKHTKREWGTVIIRMSEWSQLFA